MVFDSYMHTSTCWHFDRKVHLIRHTYTRTHARTYTHVQHAISAYVLTFLLFFLFGFALCIRRPWGHGMLGYGSVAKRYPTTFPRVIRDAGYMTCSMGKDHFGWNATSDSGIAHGYSHTVARFIVGMMSSFLHA